MPKGLIQKRAARANPPPNPQTLEGNGGRALEWGPSLVSACCTVSPLRLLPWGWSAFRVGGMWVWRGWDDTRGDTVSAVQLEEQRAHQCGRRRLSTTRTQCGGPQGDSRVGTGSAWWHLSVTEQVGCCGLGQLPSCLDAG